jgi:hypothetical protein
MSEQLSSVLPGWWRQHAHIGKTDATRETPAVVLKLQDQPATRESQAGPVGVAERSVVPMKPGNAGGGKEPQLEVNATSDEGREIGDEPNNSRKYSEVADGVTRESEGIV